jgi:hypothetical protein
MFSESEGRSGGSRLGNLLGRFKGAISRWNEVHRLDAPEMEAVARELNLSAAELGALALARSGSPQSLSRRLSHAGLSESALAASHGDVLRDLRRVCAQCRVKSRCARDLARERRATPSKYCPNEQTLRALGRGALAKALGAGPRISRHARLISINPSLPHMCSSDSNVSPKEVAP